MYTLETPALVLPSMTSLSTQHASSYTATHASEAPPALEFQYQDPATSSIISRLVEHMIEMPSDAFALEEGREAHILRYLRLGH